MENEEKKINKINNYTLYMHINKINNKKYIGITRRTVEQRWGSNGSAYKPSKRKRGLSRFYNAIKNIHGMSLSIKLY